MQINARSRVGEVVLGCPATARVFEELGIDYCCGGKISLEEACSRAGLVCNEVLIRLNKVQETPAAPDDAPTSGTLSALIDHIDQRHHRFTRDELVRANRLMTKVLEAHGASRPELSRISRLFNVLMADLGPHLQKEEMILFPYIRALDTAHRAGVPVPRPHFYSITNPLRVMDMEHEDVGTILKQLRELTNGYTPPEDACGSFRALYESLASLERDLHLHIHLENNVLFPRALSLEEQIMTDSSRAAS